MKNCSEERSEVATTAGVESWRHTVDMSSAVTILLFYFLPIMMHFAIAFERLQHAVLKGFFGW